VGRISVVGCFDCFCKQIQDNLIHPESDGKLLNINPCSADFLRAAFIGERVCRLLRSF